MKKLFLSLIAMLCVVSMNAQTIKGECYVYGVDFRFTKVVAAEESVEEFAEAFLGINRLLIREADKYDFSRLLNTRVNVDLDTMCSLIRDYNFPGMMTLNNTMPDISCSEIVRNYNLAQKEGTGVVLIARQLNKGTKKGHYFLVAFDIATREILVLKEVEGWASGFGLRNYWANTVNEIIHNKKYFVN